MPPLLTHLAEPQAVIAKWARQLRPKGLLLMEEVEWIETDHAVFGPYLKIVEALLEHQSANLYVGQVLEGLADSGELRKRLSQVRRVPVSNDRAATMFSLNIQAWKDNPFIRDSYAPSLIEGLEQELKALAAQPGSPSEIEWGLRQVVFQGI